MVCILLQSSGDAHWIETGGCLKSETTKLYNYKKGIRVMTITRGLDIKLNVKPVLLSFYHEHVFEGPCRFDEGEKLKKEFDLKANQKAFESFSELSRSFNSNEVNVLEPLQLSRNEEFLSKEEVFTEMAKGVEEIDVYFFGFTGRCQDWVVEICSRTKKPAIIEPHICGDMVVAASLLAKGLEVYSCLTMEDAIQHMKVLRVRKVLNNTTVLAITRVNSTTSPSAIDSFLSLNQVTEKLGTRFRYVDAHELFDQLSYAAPDSNHTLPGHNGLNPTDGDMEKIGVLTDELMADAEEVEMEREDVFNSMKAYYVVKKVMDYQDCNAFTIPCPDVCATMRLDKEKITFCSTHSLLQEDGIPSACEYDISALISLIILMNLSRKAPYMGNTIKGVNETISSPKFAGFWAQMFRHPSSQEEDIARVKDIKNVMLTWHSVPNRRLNGYDEEPAPYSIRSFARSGFGTTIRYDFNQDIGKTVTMLRFDPNCTKMFVAKGVIVGGIGYKDTNCSEGVFFQVKDQRDFYAKQAEFGNHVPLVYGDYVDEINALSKVLNLEVVQA